MDRDQIWIETDSKDPGVEQVSFEIEGAESKPPVLKLLPDQSRYRIVLPRNSAGDTAKRLKELIRSNRTEGAFADGSM